MLRLALGRLGRSPVKALVPKAEGDAKGPRHVVENSRRKTAELNRSSRSTSRSRPASGAATAFPSSDGETRVATAAARRWWGWMYAALVREERMPRPSACHRSSAAGREPSEPESVAWLIGLVRGPARQRARFCKVWRAAGQIDQVRQNRVSRPPAYPIPANPSQTQPT